jgi:hypothetical protein
MRRAPHPFIASFIALAGVLSALLIPLPAQAARILLVSDSGSDLQIATALMADGHTVTTMSGGFAAGSNPALLGSLTAFDVVYWSQDGTGAGAAVTDAALLANLTSYVMGGGRVFVTGLDSVASPADPMLVAFLGATGSIDFPGTAGPIAMVSNSITVGVRDIRGVVPTGGGSDHDGLTSLTTATAIVSTVASTTAHWSIRTLGAGEIVYVSVSDDTTWTNTATGGAGAYNAAIRNFAFNASVTGPCAGADGTSCTVAGVGAGICYGGVCCPGCWDATAMRCRNGRAGTACGVAGAICNSCSDDDLCTSDVCTAGVCTNPNAPSGTTCNDGAFCTATDRCDGSGSCLGTGSPCNDGASCTTDTCDELAASCMNTMLPGTCTIGGTCVTAGTPNPTNACEVCDATVSATAWTPVPTGTSCGTQRCSGGRFFPAGACSSTGICVVPSARDCPTGMCTGTICEGACTDTSCASGEFCSPTTLMCAPLVVAGGACSLGTNCVSGICTDNVCCESACDGTCERCGSTGVCTRVTSGADPDRECPGDEVCDGAGMCRMPAMMDAGVDAGAIDAGDLDAGSDAGPMDAGPDDAGNDASVDATIMRPDVQIGDAGLPPTPRGCACSTPRRTESGSAPLGLLGLALALGLTVARRRR